MGQEEKRRIGSSAGLPDEERQHLLKKAKSGATTLLGYDPRLGGFVTVYPSGKIEISNGY